VLVTLGDLAFGEQRTEVLRDDLLTRMRARHLEARVERSARSLERLEAHRARDIRGDREALRLEEAERAERCHELRSVDEREPFLRLERDRRDARLAHD